jgi:1,4-alpha-glucan branching enzyme
MKWNLGLMHESLDYFSKDPIRRRYYHDRLTFPALYAHHENFILSLSHDEVVHGKRSLLYKMPGDEFAQGREWNHDQVLDWHGLDYPLHQVAQSLVGDVKQLYFNSPALHYYDFEAQGFDGSIVTMPTNMCLAIVVKQMMPLRCFF